MTKRYLLAMAMCAAAVGLIALVFALVLHLPVAAFVVLVVAAYVLAAGLDFVPPGRFREDPEELEIPRFLPADATDGPRTSESAKPPSLRAAGPGKDRWQPWLLLPATCAAIAGFALIGLAKGNDGAHPEGFASLATGEEAASTERPAEANAVAGIVAPGTKRTAEAAATTEKRTAKSPGVGGDYDVVDTVTAGPGTGETYRFRITLKQDGNAVSGIGTGLTLKGTREGNAITVEHDLGGGKAVVFRWQLQDNGVLQGEFEDTSSSVRGTSAATPHH